MTSEKNVPIRISDQSGRNRWSVWPPTIRLATDAIELATAATGRRTARYAIQSQGGLLLQEDRRRESHRRPSAIPDDEGEEKLRGWVGSSPQQPEHSRGGHGDAHQEQLQPPKAQQRPQLRKWPQASRHECLTLQHRTNGYSQAENRLARSCLVAHPDVGPKRRSRRFGHSDRHRLAPFTLNLPKTDSTGAQQ